MKTSRVHASRKMRPPNESTKCVYIYPSDDRVRGSQTISANEELHAETNFSWTYKTVLLDIYENLVKSNKF